MTLVSKAFTTNLGAFLRATMPFFAYVRLTFEQEWLRFSMRGVPKVVPPAPASLASLLALPMLPREARLPRVRKKGPKSLKVNLTTVLVFLLELFLAPAGLFQVQFLFSISTLALLLGQCPI